MEEKEKKIRFFFGQFTDKNLTEKVRKVFSRQNNFHLSMIPIDSVEMLIDQEGYTFFGEQEITSYLEKVEQSLKNSPQN